MIAFKDDLPLVQFDGGQLAAFQRDWLVRSLRRAASKAGYPQWWLADHVAESVTTYLLLGYDDSTVTVTRLTAAVQNVLQVIGYAEVANHFVPDAPPAKLSLDEVAREAGSGYELAFFEILGRRLSALVTPDTGYLELFGLERCVKKLRAKKIWSRDCDGLREEIVCFVREQLGAVIAGKDFLLSLS